VARTYIAKSLKIEAIVNCDRWIGLNKWEIVIMIFEFKTTKSILSKLDKFRQNGDFKACARE
jgi:hypothetical protein